MLANIPRTGLRRRSGATVVETAIVMGLFMMFLFGIFEYARYIFFLQVSTNAARDGARYASVNTDKGTTFDVTSVTIGATTYTNITDYTTSRMGGMLNMITQDGAIPRIDVYPCDSSQLFANPPVVAAKTTPTPVYWNSAVFTERIAVQIHGNYRPTVPTLMLMPSQIRIHIVGLMGSEG